MILSDAATAPVYDRAAVSRLLEAHFSPGRVPLKFKIITDTTDFFRVDYNDVVVLANRPYLIRNNEREGRFGLDDEPKFWVKRAVDLVDGSTKIIKLVFHEKILARAGGIVFECVRSPNKEAAVLELVKDHESFMHGFAVNDAAGNLIRVLDFIVGKQFDVVIDELFKNHEEYFFTQLSGLLPVFIKLVDAIGFLHAHGLKHGDIRRDHILFDRTTGNWRWIDFDYDYHHAASLYGYDLFGLGNILIFLVGGGDITIQELTAGNEAFAAGLNPDDMNIIFNNRLANLQKLYPYIPDSLNYILRHFSNGAELFYENTSEMLEDLAGVVIR